MLFRQTEKMKRVLSHPHHDKLQYAKMTRLKRQSINHISKSLQNRFPDVLPNNQQGVETLMDYEEWETCHLNIKLDIPGTTEDEHSEAALKALTLKPWTKSIQQTVAFIFILMARQSMQ